MIKKKFKKTTKIKKLQYFQKKFKKEDVFFKEIDYSKKSNEENINSLLLENFDYDPVSNKYFLKKSENLQEKLDFSPLANFSSLKRDNLIDPFQSILIVKKISLSKLKFPFIKQKRYDNINFPEKIYLNFMKNFLNLEDYFNEKNIFNEIFSIENTSLERIKILENNSFFFIILANFIGEKCRIILQGFSKISMKKTNQICFFSQGEISKFIKCFINKNNKENFVEIFAIFNNQILIINLFVENDKISINSNKILSIPEIRKCKIYKDNILIFLNANFYDRFYFYFLKKEKNILRKKILEKKIRFLKICKKNDLFIIFTESIKFLLVNIFTNEILVSEILSNVKNFKIIFEIQNKITISVERTNNVELCQFFSFKKNLKGNWIFYEENVQCLEIFEKFLIKKFFHFNLNDNFSVFLRIFRGFFESFLIDFENKECLKFDSKFKTKLEKKIIEIKITNNKNIFLILKNDFGFKIIWISDSNKLIS